MEGGRAGVGRAGVGHRVGLGSSGAGAWEGGEHHNEHSYLILAHTDRGYIISGNDYISCRQAY